MGFLCAIGLFACSLAYYPVTSIKLNPPDICRGLVRSLTLSCFLRWPKVRKGNNAGKDTRHA